MSTIYDHLSKGSVKIEEEETSLPLSPPVSPAPPPKFTALKLAIGAAFLLSVGSLVGAAWLYQSLNAEKREREVLELAQSRLQRQWSKQWDEKTQASEAESQKHRSEIERMREQLKASASERNAMKTQLEKSRIQISNLQKKLQSMEDREKAIEEQTQPFRQSEEAVSAGQGMAPAEAAAPPAVSAAAPAKVAKENSESRPSANQAATANQVLTINRKFNFIVVNVGLRDGLKMGDEVTIRREGKNIGKVQVEKLYENFAAATIVQEDKDRPIQEGDAALKP